MSIGKMLSLYTRTKMFLLKEELCVIAKYYRKISFACFDMVFMCFYLFSNPYTISRRFLERKREKDIYQYGETPLTTLEKISQDFHIIDKDTVLEIGSARGRNLFWLSYFIGCQCIGIEWIPSFARKSKILAYFFQKNNITFHKGDFFAMSLKNISVIYLYGTCMSEKEIFRFLQKLQTLSHDIRIITISFALSDYTNNFITKKETAAIFPWGETTAYLNVRVQNS